VISIPLKLDDTTLTLQLKKRAFATLLGLASGAFKTKISRAFLSTGQELKCDDDLRGLLDGDEITVTKGTVFPSV
jgi:hypothetical protein